MEHIALPRRAGTAIALSCLAATLSRGSVAKADQYVVDQLLNNVVVVSVADRGQQIFGLGFVIGRAGDVVWVATAAHVVFPGYTDTNPDMSVKATNIEIRRRADNRPWKLVRPPDPGFGGDIAFLGVNMPLRSAAPEDSAAPDVWRQPVVVEKPLVGQSVVIAGQPGDIAYGAAGGRVTGFDQKGVPIVQGLVGQMAQSGGPLATPDGFIGMYTQTSINRFVPIGTIRDAARMGGYPWQLTSAIVSSPVRLCLEISGLPLGKRQVRATGDILTLDASGCVATVTGEHHVMTPAGYVCAPDPISVPQALPSPIAVQCGTDLAGIWQSNTNGVLGVLTIKRSASQLWTFEGLQIPSHGWIKGTLTSEGSKVFVNGTANSGAMVIGTVNAEGQRIRGQLTIGGTPLDLDLGR